MAEFDDRLLYTAAMKQRMREESEGHAYWALRTSGGKRVAVRTASPMVDPLVVQKVFAHELCEALNAQLGHDGTWVVGLTHPQDLVIIGPQSGRQFTRWLAMWVDGDGDVQFPVENEQDLATVLATPMTEWLEICEQGWQRWKHFMREVIQPKPEQTYRRAQGEAPPSLTRH